MTTAHHKQTKPVKEKTTKPSPTKKICKGKVAKIQKRKSSLKLVDEDEEVQHEPEPQVKDEEYDLQRGIQMSLESFLAHGQEPVDGVAIREPISKTTQKLPVVEGKGKAIATNEQAAQSFLELHKSKKRSDDTSANVVRDTPSPADAETGADTEKSHMALEDRTVELDEGQAGSDSGNTLESRPLPDEDQAGSNPRQSHVALAGPNPESMHEDFITTVYPKVHESLKHSTEEHVFLENPPSSSGTLSSMKNLDDAFTFGDQFIDDKSPKDEPGKATGDTEVESMVTVPIHQASSSIPPLSVPVIDLSPPILVSSPVQAPTITATTATTTTTTLPLPPPPQRQSTTDPELTTRVSSLEKICAEFEEKHKLQDKTTQALSSRIFTLENHDLYSKIDNYINETVKEAVHNAHQAPIRERFRELLMTSNNYSVLTDHLIRRIHKLDTTYQTIYPEQRIEFYSLNGVSILPKQYDETVDKETTMTETMEQYMSKTRENYGSGVTRPTINQDTPFELKGQFLKEFRDNTFSGSEHEDANEHIEKVLEIVDLFQIPKVTQDQIMLRAFLVSLTGAASSVLFASGGLEHLSPARIWFLNA
ncbi:hypothetical protein Tco_0678781 [Tanacetum coccineum]|uniref:Uncharacterized protein n=1 Tax=Tanacetum coccineum TaxID=301880 RepID=A0ABQ4XG27_9ASTR